MFKKYYLPFLMVLFSTNAFSQTVIVGDREWMQLTDTWNITYSQLADIYDTTTGEIDSNATNTTINGIDFSGWTWANSADVKALAESYGINFTKNNGTLSNDENSSFFGYFDPDIASDQYKAQWIYRRTREGNVVEVTDRYQDQGSGGLDYFNLTWGGNPDAVYGGYFYRSAKELVTCTGFLPPFDQQVFIKKNSNRNLPVQFNLYDKDGIELTNENIAAPIVQVTMGSNTGSSIDGYDETVLPTGLADDGNEFYYADGHWELVLGLKAYTASGSYEISVVPGDATYEIEGCVETVTRLP